MGPPVERRSLVLRGVLDLCLLALLQDQPVYGYELTERLADRGLPVAAGSTYPLLARLEKAGLVVTEQRPSPTGPPRKYYSPSGAGRAALEAGRAGWLDVAGAFSGPLAPVLHSPAVPQEVSRA